MSNKKQFHVESGEERYDYEQGFPSREILDYWVMLGKEKIKTFTYYKDAVAYKDLLNKVMNKNEH